MWTVCLRHESPTVPCFSVAALRWKSQAVSSYEGHQKLWQSVVSVTVRVFVFVPFQFWKLRLLRNERGCVRNVWKDWFRTEKLCGNFWCNRVSFVLLVSSLDILESFQLYFVVKTNFSCYDNVALNENIDRSVSVTTGCTQQSHLQGERYLVTSVCS